LAAAVLFTYGVLALFMTVNALRAPSSPSSRFPPLWLPAVLVAEAPWMWLIVRSLITIGLIGLGALNLLLGRVGLMTVIAAQLVQVELIRRSEVSARHLSRERAPTAWWERLTGWPFRIPEDVERLTDLQYAPGLLLDLYRPRQRADGLHPCLIYVHGGSWGGGNPRLQFRPVIHYLASRGWVVAAIRYPLSPVATFPEHLVGVKRSVVWARGLGLGYGIDPDRVSIAGGSAGAHLASLTALTPGRHQPGFERADTSVRAAVVLYGIYDFVNRNRTRFDWPVIPFRVMKASLIDAPDRYREASPLDQIHRKAPPILVVHGTHDSLVPPAEGIFFATAMEAAGAPTELLEVKWAQHAFDVIAGARSRALAVKVERFLDSSMAAAGLASERIIPEGIEHDTTSPDAAS
jgi:acetyl esterase/lipase